ncbi:MAG TPA: hypothetical protein VG125_29390 [Pirellulales bacterium]|jgi:hypothetical protein|nr:hypothetical protein [Pirellulales bacterium]
MRFVKRNAGGLAWLALVIVGCHAPPAMKPTRCVCTPNGPCGGYFSTCWRQWPAECASCPPMMEASEVAPPASTGGNETVPPPPPRLQETPNDLPTEMPDEPEGTQSRSRSRRHASAGAGHAATTSSERPRAPRTIAPRRPVKLASPGSDEPVVYRRTTVELLPPTDAEVKSALLIPPSYSAPK